MYRPTTKNEWWFCGTLLTQLLLVVILEIFILVQWKSWVQPNIIQIAPSYVIPVGMGIVVFACIYEVGLSLDAIHHKNNISLLAICLTNVCIVVYAVLQYIKMRDVTYSLQGAADGMGNPLVDWSRDIWPSMQPAEVTIQAILAATSLVIIPAAYRLHTDYAWAIYKCIHGSPELRLRYLAYEIYLVLIKFDFFFLTGFIIQYDLIDVHFMEPEYSLTMALIPAALVVMVAGIYCVKSGLKVALMVVIACYLGSIAYLLSRIVVLCGNSLRGRTAGREMMLFFAAVALVLIVLTVGCAVQCILNLNYGLKVAPVDSQGPQSSHAFQTLAAPMSPSLGGALARMSIDAKVLGRSVVTDDRLLDSSGVCPELSPIDYPRWDPRTYATYRASYSLDHAYRMNTLATTIRLRLNDTDVSCIAANITPYIGSTASRVLKGIPLLVMILTGVINGALMICRIRGRRIFRYELANASRDPAESYFPGMGDCLQYIQFIFLTGCLTLSYPGFFRASVGELAWSSLVLKNWPVTHQFIYPGVQDNIYAVNATYGFEEMAQYLGATTMSDLWTNAVVNLALLILGVVVTAQIMWLIKWAWQLFPTRGSTLMIDLPREFLAHLEHTGWSVARILLNYFLHPIVALSLYQTRLATWFPVYRTFLAVSFVAALAASLAFIVRYLAKDDRQNTFFNKGSYPRNSSQDWLSDALYMVPFLRGLAIGALQSSGLGQILVLISCEMFILACLLWNWREQRAWRHACFATARLVIIGMSCAFLPRAGVREGNKALVGYFIISLHAAVLFAGFIVDCVYELVRFVLSKMGIIDPRPADLDHHSDKAPVFGIGQLSRRSTRRMSFARLPALNPAEISVPYTQRPSTPRRPSFLGDLPTRDEYSSFFRAPRSETTSIRSAWSVVSPSSPSQSESESRGSSMESVELEALDLESKSSENVDYTYREADQYYGRPPTSAPAIQNTVQSQGESSNQGKEEKKRGPWRWKRKQKQKGFEVIRPKRTVAH
ncbi:hypothetical protein ABOM_004877 [Aspergillus bombycis]|uniref:TRP C-terminal domain-containing protein n=1 Tax=Aspergillus bombycis TaxID=109264 RepID=A0A1F8A494_9EURO|nr:hypothetical protein ABOM_004877 [Aspergillus bombycis]OGM46128.1 hypothetical protein ABOM_004877 [Aspergillus bombycis]